MVDVKLETGLEVSTEATLAVSVVVNIIGTTVVESVAAWGSMTLTVDMTCGVGTLAAIMPCADPAMNVPGVCTVSIVVRTPANS